MCSQTPAHPHLNPLTSVLQSAGSGHPHSDLISNYSNHSPNHSAPFVCIKANWYRLILAVLSGWVVVGILYPGNLLGNFRTGTDLRQCTLMMGWGLHLSNIYGHFRICTDLWQSWWLYSTKAWDPTQSHYPYTELTNLCPALIIPSARLGNEIYRFC